jgi:hypothetical protein
MPATAYRLHDADHQPWTRDEAARVLRFVPHFPGGWEADDIVLWQRATGVPGQGREDAVAELVAREADGIGAFLVAELARAEAGTAWHALLVHGLERTPDVPSASRSQAARLLLEAARIARAARDAALLGSALRRFASLCDAAEIGSLLEFLRPGEPPAALQTALQGVANVFESGPPGTPTTEITALARRVSELARKYQDPDLLGSADNAALAMNAIVAVCALGVDEIPLDLDALETRPGLVRLVGARLRHLAESWRTGKDHPARARLEGALAATQER